MDLKLSAFNLQFMRVIIYYNVHVFLGFVCLGFVFALGRFHSHAVVAYISRHVSLKIAVLESLYLTRYCDLAVSSWKSSKLCEVSADLREYISF